MFHLPGQTDPRPVAHQSEQTSKQALERCLPYTFQGLAWARPKAEPPGSQLPGVWAGGWAEQTSKQATPPIGLWFFVERSTLIVLEPKANRRGTTDKGEATTDHGQPILVLVRARTDERHIF